jgi:hypothetical protein
MQARDAVSEDGEREKDEREDDDDDDDEQVGVAKGTGIADAYTRCHPSFSLFVVCR